METSFGFHNSQGQSVLYKFGGKLQSIVRISVKLGLYILRLHPIFLYGLSC